MAPLPPNSTPVYFLDYVFNGQAHTMQFRGRAGVTATQLQTVASDYVNQIDVLACTGWAITGARFRAAGADVSLPAPAPAAITPAGGTMSPSANPRFITHSGRGLTSGRRWRLYVYGLVFTFPDDYRLALTDVPALAAAHNVLALAMDTGILGTVADDEAGLYDYINVGFNSYWEREQRG